MAPQLKITHITDPGTDSSALTNSSFIKACRLEQSEFTPVWLMRQAGRYMPEYRAIREKLSFLELCKRPDVAAEVTVMAVDKLGVDAAIIFADILLILEPLGVGLEFTKGDGPVIPRPVRASEDVDRLKHCDVERDLSFVLEAIRLTRAALRPNIPLIGFAGAPFTLASYLIEGGASRHFETVKNFIYSQPQTWSRLMAILSQLTAEYLNHQVKAGAQAVQLFDSWAGCLAVDDYKDHVLPHLVNIVDRLDKQVPIIYFATGSSALIPVLGQLGVQVIGLDWRVDLACEWIRLGYDVAIQGNLDPTVLLAPQGEIAERAKKILAKAEGRPGHIFNLGHGVLPQTPVDNVRFLVDTVHRLSAR